MSRLRSAILRDFLPSAVSWGVVVVMFGLPIGLLVAGLFGLFPKGESEAPIDLDIRVPWVVQQLRTDGSPVMRTIADGEYTGRDRVDSLISKHPPDAVVVSRSITLCYYRGVRAKEVKGLVVVAENKRLACCIVLAERGGPGMDQLFAPLPLLVRSEAELHPDQAWLQLEVWQGLQATVGGGGAVVQPVNDPGE